MFLGAIFRAVKGGYDAVTIRKKIKEYQEELERDFLSLFPPYERFFASERLLLAEYSIELSKMQARRTRVEELLRLEERMNRLMKKMVETAENELAARPATKLDLARLINSLREMSLAVDKDLTAYRKEITGETQKLQAQITNLGKRIEEQSDRLVRQSQQAQDLEKKAQNVFASVENFNKELQKQKLTVKNRIGWVWLFNVGMLVLVMIFLFRR